MTLSDLCDLVSNQVDPRDHSTAHYVGLEHVASGRFTRIGGGTAADVQSSKFAYKKGDILYGKLRPYLDKAVVADDSGVCATELLVLRPKAGVDARFLIAILHSQDFIQHAVSGTTGVQHPRTPWHRISEYELPDFTEHERTIIANLSWSVQDSLITCERAVEYAYDLKREAMVEFLPVGHLAGSRLKPNLDRFRSVGTLSRLIAVPKSRLVLPRAVSFLNADMVEVSYLRVANVQDGHLDLTEMKTIRIRSSEIERYRLQPGDVVLTEGGDFDKLGRGFIWRGELDLCVHQNHVFAVRGRIIPEFFAYLAQSSYGKAYFLQVAHKTTNLACINSTKLKAFPVLIPRLDEQREIVRILTVIDRKIDLLKRKQDILEQIFKSLLQRIVTGDISIANLDEIAVQSRVTAEAAA
jgi:type I restriction enzyme, S subunit